MDLEDLDLAIISDPNSVYYFTGLQLNIPILSSVFSLTLPTYLFASKGEEPVLLTGQRNQERAEETFGGQVKTYVHYAMDQRMIAYPDFVANEAKKILQSTSSHTRRIGVETWHIPRILTNSATATVLHAEYDDLSDRIVKMRIRKDPDEIEALRQACELNDFAYRVAKEFARPGTTEIEVYSKMQEELTRKVGFYQLFAGDVVSGERAIDIAGPPTHRTLKKGETFVLDLWLTARGYWSDACRTFVVGGSPTSEQRQILELLERAMAAGEEKLRPGVEGREVHEAVFGVIAKAGYRSYFPHHAGHALGLDDQEPPFFIPACKDKLVEGVVCTLEPGVYIPDRGGFRIENDYLVRANGIEQLTKFPLDL